MVLTAITLSGCLLPQEDELLEPIVQKNRPPRVIELNVVPNRSTTVHPSCVSGLSFSAFVEDPDIDDVVTVRWYLDFDPSNAIARLPVFEDRLTAPQRSEAARLSGSTIAERLGTIDTHVVDLMVFDGNLGTFEGPGSQPPSEAVPGLDAGDPRYSTTFTWVVNVDTGAPPCL